MGSMALPQNNLNNGYYCAQSYSNSSQNEIAETDRFDTDPALYISEMSGEGQMQYGEQGPLMRNRYDTSYDTNWGSTYCRLRRASAMIGASTVAIDNKIEQAMDLVKTHLMFAVREEVEVLKEQINSLLQRNQLLEYENQILRASAQPKTLANISSQMSSQRLVQSSLST